MVARFIAAGRLDRRTWYARMREWLADNIADCLGGWEKLDFIMRLRVWEAADQGAELVPVRRRRAQQITKGEPTTETDKFIIAASNSYCRLLGDLGLTAAEMMKRQEPTLEQYLKSRPPGTNGNGSPSTAAVQSVPPTTVPQPSPSGTASHHDGTGAQRDDHATGQPTASPTATTSPPPEAA
jgi:hypothetical protein